MKTSGTNPVSWKHFNISMQDVNSGEIDGTCPGLTKREYFAALAMQGVTAEGPASTAWIDEIAAKSVEMADALIEALNKPANK